MFATTGCLIAGDCNTSEGRPIFVVVVQRHGWWYGVIYGFNLGLMTFAPFNVIVAIYVENTVAAAKFNDRCVKRAMLYDQQLFTDTIFSS